MKKLLRTVYLVGCLMSVVLFSYAMNDGKTIVPADSPKIGNPLWEDFLYTHQHNPSGVFQSGEFMSGSSTSSSSSNEKDTEEEETQGSDVFALRRSDSKKACAKGLIESHISNECLKDPVTLVDALQAMFNSANRKIGNISDDDVVEGFCDWFDVDIDQIKHNNGDTPLHYAAEQGYDWVCKILLAVGAKADVCNNEGLVSLHKASMKEHKSTCKILIQACGLSEARLLLSNSMLGSKISDTAQQALDEIEAGEWE